MNIEAFWAITIIVLLLRHWWKNEMKEEEFERESRLHEDAVRPLKKTGNTIKSFNNNDVDKARKEIERQKKRDIAELKKQGYDDELIAVILPTIYNDGQ